MNRFLAVTGCFLVVAPAFAQKSIQRFCAGTGLIQARPGSRYWSLPGRLTLETNEPFVIPGNFYMTDAITDLPGMGQPGWVKKLI